MGNIVRFIYYILLTLLGLGCLIYYLANTYVWDLYGYNLGFLFLIASIIYTTFMIFYEIIKPSEENVFVVSDRVREESVINRNFMVDVYFKYLFSFSFAVLAFYIIYMFQTNFKYFDLFPTPGSSAANWYYAVDIFVNLILPLCLLLELIITNRYRHRHLVADVSVLFMICFIHGIYKILVRTLYYKDYKMILPIVGDYLMIYFISLNGYALYDFSLSRKIKPEVVP